MGYKIFTHEIRSSYAARVDNFRSYDTISKDIMQRWTYPFVPDVQYFGNSSGIKLDRQGVYKAPGKGGMNIQYYHIWFHKSVVVCILLFCWNFITTLPYMLYFWTFLFSYCPLIHNSNFCSFSLHGHELLLTQVI